MLMLGKHRWMICLVASGGVVAILQGCEAGDSFTGKPLYSPDKRYKAILFSEYGGGAMSPYCFDYVSVVPASLGIEKSSEKKFHVYEGGCHSFGTFGKKHNGLPVMENAPLLNWVSASELEVVFDKNKASRGINKPVYLHQSSDGQVRIAYKDHAAIHGVNE